MQTYTHICIIATRVERTKFLLLCQQSATMHCCFGRFWQSWMNPVAWFSGWHHRLSELIDLAEVPLAEDSPHHMKKIHHLLRTRIWHITVPKKIQSFVSAPRLNLRHAKSLRVGLYLLGWAESNVQVFVFPSRKRLIGIEYGKRLLFIQIVGGWWWVQRFCELLSVKIQKFTSCCRESAKLVLSPMQALNNISHWNLFRRRGLQTIPLH